MKNLFILSICFLSLEALGQAQGTTKVILSLNDCRSNEPYHRYRYDIILFYKLPQDTLSFKVIPGLYKGFPIQLEDIQIAEYKLKYKNSFMQDVVDTIDLKEKDVNNITLCTNKLLTYNKNTLSELHDKDSILINFHSESCFGSRNAEIVILKESDKVIATLYNISQDYKITKPKISFSNSNLSFKKG